ncbi:MAG: hypothetical protein H6559_13015 [Lewinellaceae bacterium]|nr:hypothetical protein [Lewinellaceae bacterium]
MKPVLLSGLGAGIVLLGLSYFILYVTINFFPGLVEEYYNPIFWPGNDRALLFFVHPFVLSFALAWFWSRFKAQLPGYWLLRGLKFGLAYALLATLPSMWITFSAITVSLGMVFTWFAYGLLQAVVCGWVFARMNP